MVQVASEQGICFKAMQFLKMLWNLLGLFFFTLFGVDFRQLDRKAGSNLQWRDHFNGETKEEKERREKAKKGWGAAAGTAQYGDKGAESGDKKDA